MNPRKTLAVLKSRYNSWFSSLRFCRKLRRMCIPTTASSEPVAASAAWLTAMTHARAPRGSSATWAVACVGHLAPTTDFDGTVHSVFAHACNIAASCGLLTIVVRGLADGPTVWRLATDHPGDFRHLFRRGERLRRRGARAATRDVVLDLSVAASWRPAPWPRPSHASAVNLQMAAAALQRRRRVRSSVIDREAETFFRSLGEACRHLDVARATVEIDRLVGWGEGLTPAGDDALVGLLAGMAALAGADARRVAFLGSLSAAVAASAARTTDISAHYLRLAAAGHFNADVTHLVHALAGGDSDDTRIRDALDAALAAGATSGADMVAGMIAGLRTWCAENE